MSKIYDNVDLLTTLRRVVVMRMILIMMTITITQRQKNLGSRVALLPGKFLRVRKVFARITQKTFLTVHPDLSR